MPEEDRATAIGNMHENLVKVARVVPEISSRTDRQTDIRTQMYSSQYFAIINHNYIHKIDAVGRVSK